ncbi:glycoside hydrolase domain-containing protein [Chitinophaga nivalis]|uniref:Glycoside hydrolase 123 C-terminal domain-containing protein n=1 Tax=Chitinophaga nivalis TaxID=2991709 RepID=A0ABT3INT5_9BACT|nr:glycoside hydrolase domain-containing protein [Chitinophaga nivalis]MCW3464666.1 hypothetical protein [Chitinophaga nivalis]MCW3485643.1 hypothetical protein [Chitinophaga nivalis]
MTNYLNIRYCLNSTLLGCCLLLGIMSPTRAQRAVTGLDIKVTPDPNYSLTKDQSKLSSLTDGKYTTGPSFWKDPGTLGWQNADKITFNIALDRSLPVAQINLNTVTGQKAQVNLPLNVLAFVSNNQQDWQFVGDLMEQQPVKNDYYRITPVSLKNIGQSARYIKLVVVPDGSYFFTDEIQVLTGQGSANRAAASGKQYTEASLPAMVKSSREAAINKRFSGADQKSLPMAAASSTMAAKSTGSGGINLTPLSSAFGEALTPGEESTHITTLKGLTEYAAFVVANNSATEKNIQLDGEGAGVSSQLYWAKPVKSRDFKVVPDALTTIKEGSSLSLKGNESRLLLVKITGKQAGSFKYTLQAKDGSATVSKPVTIQVLDNALSALQGGRPDINVWAYLNEPLLKGKEESARQDLLQHYVNTFVFHPGILLPNIPVADNKKLAAMLPYVKGFSKVLLFLDFSAPVARQQASFMDASWKQAFLKWYDDMLVALKSQGIASDNVYLYPFDEVKAGQVAALNNFSTWIKSARKEARLFATVSNPPVYEGVIGQLNACQLFYNDNVLREYRKNKPSACQVWMYDTKKPTKSLSPYSYYRLMGWKAFAAGTTGFGFWQYADIGHGKETGSVWDDFDGSSADFAVVYDEGNRIIPSRRWEAFRAGVEDYMLLAAYAKKNGQQAAAALCADVLRNTNDPVAAAAAREKMIKTFNR